MTSWHAFGAKQGFIESLKLHGPESVYGTVELGRQAAWDTSDPGPDDIPRQVIGQSETGEETLQQLWCRGKIELLLAQGALRWFTSPVGSTPRPDKQRQENQRALDDGLSGLGLHGKVDGSPGQTDDGEITWHQPIELRARPSSGSEPIAVLSPSVAPLEIGTTLPSRTFTHLYETGAVWRWPYRSNEIWLLAHVTHHPDWGWRIEPRCLS